jgi:hypothetical protein
VSGGFSKGPLELVIVVLLCMSSMAVINWLKIELGIDKLVPHASEHFLLLHAFFEIKDPCGMCCCHCGNTLVRASSRK